jgi:hypothetical protein
MHHDLVRIAAIGGRFTIAFKIIIGAYGTIAAKLIQSLFSVIAFPAGVYQAAYARQVTRLEPRNGRTHLANPAYDLMARYHWVFRIAPLIPHLVNVRMANATVEDLEMHIVRVRLSSFKCKWR